jgi:hypothetical protein
MQADIPTSPLPKNIFYCGRDLYSVPTVFELIVARVHALMNNPHFIIFPKHYTQSLMIWRSD